MLISDIIRKKGWIRPSRKSIGIIVSQSCDTNRMVLSRVGNYRLLLQRQLRTKPKITSKILAWETQTSNYGRACAHDILHPRSLSLPYPLLFILPFSLSLFLSHSLSLAGCITARESYGGTYERAFITYVYARRSAARICRLVISLMT